MDNPPTITILSLCSGYGGLELGLSRALANPLRVVAVEIEAYALANLVAKAEEGKLAVEALWPDLRSFPAERFRGCFDLLLAGYPCQPFSVAGKRQGADDPRHLWPAIARIVEAVEPFWCFFENVPGHLNLGFPDVYCSLRAMGYKVEAGLFTAAECGAPHKRQRLFILANKSGERLEGQTGSGILGKSIRPTSDCRATGQLADTERAGARPGILQEPPTGIGRDRLAEQRPVVGDAPAQRVQGPEPAGPILPRRPPDEQGTQWPARPGEPQYEWEEPRALASRQDARRRRQEQVGQTQERIAAGGASPVVGDAEHTGPRRTGRTAQRSGDRPSVCAEEAESCMGRTTDGTSCRVDRLRLLGNGVVPQQAEKAFRELYEEMFRGK